VAQLRSLRSDDLAAIDSRHRSRQEPAPDQVLAHERVLKAIMERGAVLPLRFGTHLDSEEELASALRDRQEPLLRALERVRGRVELGVRVLAERERRPPAAERSGRDYMLERVAEHRRSEQAARELHDPLAKLAVASRKSEPPSPPTVLVGSYLVEAAEVERFRRCADVLNDGQDELRVVVTGPWAPYSFVDEEPA
jgi:hypothetical protein